MKILLYGLNFAPEPTGIGKYSGEMAAFLASAGHEVRVIAAPPYYPAWQIAPGYSAWRGCQEQWRGVRIWRTPLWVPARPSGIKRVLHLLSFATLSLPVLLKQVFWGPDVIIVIAPALACAPGAWLAAKLSGARSWLHIQDFEVDAAFRLGLLKGGLIQCAMRAFESWTLQRFDRVSTISKRMLGLLSHKRVHEDRLVLLRNWVDVHAIAPTRRVSAYRVELGIPEDAVVALFSGSMGAKQGLELLPVAARHLSKQESNLFFVFCGDGVFKPTLERECADLANVRLIPLQPLERLGELLGMADFHLLTQHAQAADLVMPSKLTGMLSSGRPVLATAHPETELADVVAGRGIVVPPNDPSAFIAGLVLLTRDALLRAELGAAARSYAETCLSSERVLGDLDEFLKRLVEGGDRPTQASRSACSALPVQPKAPLQPDPHAAKTETP